ncbi:MAG: nitronate monooxygenase [Candidatus Cloacimonadaceae bacterium]|nr:nitronate monooxygenase [Candidatus Cloacimonadaceae bacterium]MDP3113283.1 nitronate monooxygenase [Candidatus Cloacimonadaceae bacterium]
MTKILPQLKIGDLIAKLPILQGGMGVGISLSKLAAAVANEGGIGIISSVGLGLLRPSLGKGYREANIAALRDEIRAARKLTNGILGLNIMLAISDFDEMIRVAFEEEIDIVFLGAGLPLKVPSTMTLEYLQNTKTKIGIIVSSARATKLILNHWAQHFHRIPDIVVVEGPKAGGHLGFKREQIFDPDYALENILPQVKLEVKAIEDKHGKRIPVIAAGGIFTGEQIYKIMDLGADGVQLGTRFVATEECDADDTFKQLFVDCTEDEILIIDSPVGLPGRAINNQFLKDVTCGEKHPFTCPWKCLKTCDYHTAPYCIALALQNARNGLFAEGFAFAGANAYLVKNITTVKELIRDLLQEYQDYYDQVVNKGKLKLAPARD